ncbi:hypothetical protein FOA43_003016 [Brettanomyces nanus]|uniref:XPA C-terminal domain-containing protein n=1 Tax=Eeniella nana TaxID=13502 RepID=A0A875S3Y0_EENNA|nr:uncharacterized protein FOA43_003016 [Brettanomyces nanus]QPG75658.1 hypothetical protein FOA43_003016 [Brettanomyces nanus]
MNFDRQKKIAENRAKALERIRDRQRRIKDAGRQVTSATTAENVVANPLTAAQRAIIERNTLNAQERRNKNNKKGPVMESGGDKPDILDEVRFSHHQQAKHIEALPRKPGQYIRPSIRKSDYIEYDFSTMKDTFGGFLSDDKGNSSIEAEEKTLEDWKKQQEEKDALNPLGPAPPPLDIANAPTCFECGSIDVDKKLLEVFKCRVCRKCEEKFPEKYSLLTKTECKEDYFLTEPELADTDLFRRIVKENPHSGTFSRMQLFLRYQIEEYAFKKWGGVDNLDKEWLKREGMRKNRREKKFNTKLNQMRRKLRAQEITRKIRGDKGVRHQHDWSAPVKVGGDDPHLYKRRCMECGMEVEEIIM